MEKRVYRKPNFFQYRIRTLRLMGCWPRIGFLNTKGEKIYTFICVITLINSAVGAFLSFASCLTAFAAEGDFNEKVCNQVIVFIMAFQIFTKALVTAVKAHRMQDLVDDLNGRLHDKFVTRPVDRMIMEKCFSYDKKLAVFFCVLSSVIITWSVLKPIAITMRRRSVNATLVLGELPSKYPFEVDSSSYWYGFWFVQELIAFLPCSMSSWASDSMFCSFLYYLCGHFDILVEKIRHETSNLSISSVGMVKTLVLHHRSLIAFSNELIQTFAPLMVTQLLLGGVTIACLMLQFLLMSGDLISYLRPGTYFILKLIQLYILCWHGQLLWDKSISVGEAVYTSPWYNGSESYRKDLQTMMIRARKPIRFSYAGIFEFSAGRYGNILNASYGYFAMMRTMKKD